MKGGKRDTICHFCRTKKRKKSCKKKKKGRRRRKGYNTDLLPIQEKRKEKKVMLPPLESHPVDPNLNLNHHKNLKKSSREAPLQQHIRSWPPPPTTMTTTTTTTMMMMIIILNAITIKIYRHHAIRVDSWNDSQSNHPCRSSSYHPSIRTRSAGDDLDRQTFDDDVVFPPTPS